MQPTPPPSRPTPPPRGELPPLAWSYSRHRLLESCERAIYWQYDGAHRGYDATAAAPARLAWVLKHLTSLPLLLGTAVHQAGRALLLAARDETEPPSLDAATEAARTLLNQVWFTSVRQQNRFWEMPGVYTALHEVIYRGALSDGEISRTRERLQTCLRHLYAAPVLADVRAALACWPKASSTPALHIGSGLPVSFVIADGTTVWVDLDLGYPHLAPIPEASVEAPGGATWCIGDFKTGSPSAEEPLQLAVYGLYSRDVLHIPMTDGAYLGRIVDLARAEDRWIRITDDLIDGVPEIIAEDMARMRALRAAAVLEPEHSASAYALAQDRRSCARCNYRQLCAPELAAIRDRIAECPPEPARPANAGRAEPPPVTSETPA